eukprot:3305169-Amphidinium_carterae.2
MPTNGFSTDKNKASRLSSQMTKDNNMRRDVTTIDKRHERMKGEVLLCTKTDQQGRVPSDSSSPPPHRFPEPRSEHKSGNLNVAQKAN